jgi:hypothetical protein
VNTGLPSDFSRGPPGTFGRGFPELGAAGGRSLEMTYARRRLLSAHNETRDRRTGRRASGVSLSRVRRPRRAGHVRPRRSAEMRLAFVPTAREPHPGSLVSRARPVVRARPRLQGRGDRHRGRGREARPSRAAARGRPVRRRREFLLPPRKRAPRPAFSSFCASSSRAAGSISV